jgi:class 3 adenylate cyclase
MEPPIQYCTTADGLSIAYWSIGQGDAIIDAGQPPTHIQMEWRLAPIRAWYERFARRHQFIRFDTRGTGLSDRDVDAYSLDTMVSDLEAVADAVPLDHFTLIGSINSAPSAIAYAARHPERVSKLILWCAYSRGADFFDDPGTKALRDMVERDWHMLSETASRSRFSWSADSHAREYAMLWRAAITPRVQAILMDGLQTVDVTPLLGRVRAPTLVVQREDRGAEIARRISAGIAGARLRLLPGGSAAPYLDDADNVWSVIAAFLGDKSVATTTEQGDSLRTILYSDMESNTQLLQLLGDEAWRRLLREHEHITREALARHGGEEIKAMGDGFMVSFPSATRALECAVAMQQTFARRNTSAAHPIRVRIGVNAGEPIAEEGDLFGTAVTMAARIMGQARGGEILVSDVVRQLVAGKGYRFSDRGESELRGFDHPVRIYELRLPVGARTESV